MSMQSQFKSKVLSVLLENIEPMTVIKNEPEIVEIGINDILGSSDEEEEIILDIKDDIDIVYHKISEDLVIKGENILERKHLESIETEVVIQTENIPFIKTENIDMTEDTRDGDGNLSRGTDQSVEEAQDLNGNNTRSRKAIHPQKKDFSECHKTVKTTSCKKIKEKRKVTEIPLPPVKPHEYTSLTKDEDACNKNKSTCKKTKAKMHNWRLKYSCNRCKYKSSFSINLKRHKLIHLKPDEIQYFYCHHCVHKSKQKSDLKTHIFGHFKREEIQFHCYICDFVTLKRDLIIKHFKKHPKHHSKCDETDYKNHLETYTKIQMRHYSCKKCAFRTYHYEKLQLHELIHKAEMDDRHFNYRCNKCTYKTFRHQDFKRHKLIHLKPEEIHYFYCDHCSYTCKQKYNLQTHIFRHFNNEEIPFHCYICDFMTRKRNLIIEHFKKHPKYHSKFDETEYKNQLETYTKKHKMRYYSCKKCALRTYHYEKLKLHELTHKTEAETDDRHLKYRCNKCNYKTFRYHDFKGHTLIHLKPEEIQNFYCYHCSYKSKWKNHLREHIFRHSKNEEIKFHCYICNFMTLKREAIVKHIQMHSKVQFETDTEKQQKRYWCAKCMFVTGKSAEFKQHKLSHKIKKHYIRFRCDKCNYKTNVRSSFQMHQLIHLKPEEIQYFYCYHCTYKSKRKNNLTDHILRHFNNEKVKFHCYICDFVTLKRKSITEHIKKHSQVRNKSKIK